MGKAVLSAGLKKIRGRIGRFVYRILDGEQIVSQVPDMSGVKWSPAQVAHRQRFREAVAHAKAMMRDEKLKAAYVRKAARKGMRPFDLAVSEYFKGEGVKGEK